MTSVTPLNPQCLKEVSREFQSLSPRGRKVLLENWEVFNVLANEADKHSGPSFIKESPVKPREVAAQGKGLSFTSEVLMPASKFGWKLSKSASKVGDAAAKGQFGNFLKVNAHTWDKINGELAKGLSSKARYVRQMDGTLRMIPKDARALQMGGKVISVQPNGSGYANFVKTVRNTKSFASKAAKGAKGLGWMINLGLAANCNTSGSCTKANLT